MLAVAILAAGKGTRMYSSMPKVLHKLSGKTLLNRVLDSCNGLKPDKVFVLVGHKSNEIEKSLSIHFDLICCQITSFLLHDFFVLVPHISIYLSYYAAFPSWTFIALCSEVANSVKWSFFL